MGQETGTDKALFNFKPGSGTSPSPIPMEALLKKKKKKRRKGKSRRVFVKLNNLLFSSHDNISIINHTQRANARRD